jgi:hypothetical protein
MRGAFRHTIYQRKSERSAEIHKKIVVVYGDIMNQQNVTKKETSHWEKFRRR